MLGQGHGNYGTFHERGAVLNPRKHWMMFRANGAALARLPSIDFAALARGNTSTPGFRKGDLVKAYQHGSADAHHRPWQDWITRDNILYLVKQIRFVGQHHRRRNRMVRTVRVPLYVEAGIALPR